MPEKWSLADIWNMVAFTEERPLVKRDYAYASELGGSLFDRYLKMTAVPMTSPPNQRSRGKFMAGNIWQHVVEKVLRVSGMLRETEVKIDAYPYSDTIAVHGRCDIIAGPFDKQQALHNLAAIKDFLPEDLVRTGAFIINFLGDKDLELKIMEFKSCSEYVVEKVLTMKQPIKTHGMQAYHYSRATKMPACVSYISKNDNVMAEATIDPKVFEGLLRADLEQMTYYFTKGIQPPLDPILLWNPLLAKFEKNNQVEWSPYIQLHGYASPFEFRKVVVPTINRWNNVLTRYAKAETGALTPTGKKIEIKDNNKKVRKEIEQHYDFEELLRVKVQFGADLEEEIED